MSVGIDTSVGVALLVRSHRTHDAVVRWWDAEQLALSIAGGVYDAIVALAAKDHGAPLATRDGQARGTYDAVSVQIVVVT